MDSLVLCVDRDNDVGQKVRIPGPIVGWKKCLEVAQALALVDPEDSDVNAIYAAVKLAKRVESEVAILTGDVRVGVESDRKVARQLDEVLKKYKPRSVFLVSDGAEDDQVIPIIQSRVPITSVQNVVVRQSQELEKAYFTITNFLKEVSADPQLSRMFFALPGVALVFLYFFGLQAMLAIIGVYLVIKGLGYEEAVFEQASQFVHSLSIERISTLTYMVAAIVFLIAGAYGFADYQRTPINWSNVGSGLDSAAIFALSSSSINLALIALVIAVLGRITEDLMGKKFLEIRRYLILLAFFVLVKVVATSAASFLIKEEYGLGHFIREMVVGVFAFAIWVKFTKYLFVSELERVQAVVDSYQGREVVTADGTLVGNVSKVLLSGGEFAGIKVKRKKYGRADIVSAHDVIVVRHR